MDVACEHCQARFKIPDEKVPKNQVFAITCPKCKKKISVDTRTEAAAPPPKPAPKAEKTLVDEVSSGSYDASDRPFDFLEEGVETALICEPDEAVRAKIQTALKNMGYLITAPKNAREVLKQMRFHVFELVVINEMFDSPDPDQNNILRYLERLKMDTRREMFVVLITNRFRTMDNMTAFVKSVNLVINLSNIDEIEKIMQRAITDNTAFYKVFKESMVKAGKA